MVEDDNDLFEALKKGLETWSLRVNRANDFEEVMRSFLYQQPHLVIMDVSSLNLTIFTGAERFSPCPKYLFFLILARSTIRYGHDTSLYLSNFRYRLAFLTFNQLK